MPVSRVLAVVELRSDSANVEVSETGRGTRRGASDRGRYGTPCLLVGNERVTLRTTTDRVTTHWDPPSAFKEGPQLFNVDGVFVPGYFRHYGVNNGPSRSKSPYVVEKETGNSLQGKSRPTPWLWFSV